MNRLIHKFLLLSLCLPLLTFAQVYKWKDKDGVTRYTDTPPPSNIKQQQLQIQKPKVVTPANPAKAEDSAEFSRAAGGKNPADPVNPEDAAAEKRRFEAENAKNDALAKEAAAKQKQESCKMARANLQNYTQGGRIYRMKENGEREYLDDKSINEGLVKAQKDVEKYCD